MKRLYTYSPVREDDDFYWIVEEESTDQVIESFYFEEDAVEYMEWLEGGGAFAGFTPSFILVSAKLKEDVNEAFAATFSQDLAKGATI